MTRLILTSLSAVIPRPTQRCTLESSSGQAWSIPGHLLQWPRSKSRRSLTTLCDLRARQEINAQLGGWVFGEMV
jgi:hypothetical protein